MPSRRESISKSGELTVSWIVYFTTEEGKRTSRAFSTKAKAASFERVCKSQPKKKRAVAKGHATLRDLIDRYISDSIVGRDGGEPWRESTLANAHSRIKVLEKFIDLDTPLRALSVADMKELRKDIQASSLARSSQISLWTFLKSIFSYGVIEEVMVSNPMDGLIIRKARLVGAGEEKVEAYSKEEAQALVRTAQELSVSTNLQKQKAYRYTWLLVPLLFETGMRIGELLALEWDNVDLDEGMLHVRQGFIRESKDVQKVKAAASHRSLVLSSPLIPHLRKLKERGTRFVFETYNNTPLQYHNALHWWYRLQEAAGVETGGFHKARHYYASRLIEAGVDAKVLTTNLGHSDVAFTLQVYGHLFDDRDTRDRKRQLAEELSTLSL